MTVFEEISDLVIFSVENPGGLVVIVLVTPGSDKQTLFHGMIEQMVRGPISLVAGGNTGGNGHTRRKS